MLPYGSLSTKMLSQKTKIDFSIPAYVIYLGLLCSILFFGPCGIDAVTADEKQIENVTANKNTENPISQVRYRSRPVAAFRSGSKGTNNSTNNSSSEIDGPEPSGVPFIAVHDLTSQTFEKLQENWRNLEVFIRNYHARRSQEESRRSSSPSASGGVAASGVDNSRRPPYNNVYTFKYHPVVLQGEGSSSVDDLIGGNTRNGGGNAKNESSVATPPRTFHFNPFPIDPRGEGSKNADMERHTIATIYTIGICLAIMVVGSLMFILINKCDGADDEYIRPNASGNRISRSVIGAARGARQNGGRSNRNNNNRGARNNNNNVSSQANANIHVSGVGGSDAKNVPDLPPSYESLFPEGGPKKQPELETTNNTAASSQSVIEVNLNSSSSHNSEGSRPTQSTTTLEV